MRQTYGIQRHVVVDVSLHLQRLTITACDSIEISTITSRDASNPRESSVQNVLRNYTYRIFLRKSIARLRSMEWNFILIQTNNFISVATRIHVAKENRNGKSWHTRFSGEPIAPLFSSFAIRIQFACRICEQRTDRLRDPKAQSVIEVNGTEHGHVALRSDSACRSVGENVDMFAVSLNWISLAVTDSKVALLAQTRCPLHAESVRSWRQQCQMSNVSWPRLHRQHRNK